jgi:uncharacterized protein (DUF1697 family)
MKGSYFTLLNDIPGAEHVCEIQNLKFPNEEFVITDSCVYFYSSVGYGRAKRNNYFFEKKLKITATTRNYKTLTKLLSLCEDLS